MSSIPKKSAYSWDQIEQTIGNLPPKPINGYWHRWDIAASQWANTGVAADTASYAAEAKESATQAANSATQSANSATQAETAARSAAKQAASEAAADVKTTLQGYVDKAGTSASEAEASRQAIENMGVDAVTTAPGSDATISKTTDESGTVSLHFGIPRGNTGAKGDKGDKGDQGEVGSSIVSIEKTSTSGLVDTYTVTMSDGVTSTFTVRNGKDGTGAGDMTKDIYDPDNAVADAGGIKAYVDEVFNSIVNANSIEY